MLNGEVAEALEEHFNYQMKCLFLSSNGENLRNSFDNP